MLRGGGGRGPRRSRDGWRSRRVRSRDGRGSPNVWLRAPCSHGAVQRVPFPRRHHLPPRPRVRRGGPGAGVGRAGRACGQRGAAWRRAAPQVARDNGRRLRRPVARAIFLGRSSSHGRLKHQMCGIIGVSGVPDAARVAYLGLYSLQHRGQESAGIVAVDGTGVARSHRGMGLVADIFGEAVLADLAGDVAIGHTRYSTAGSSVLANAQPMLARYREGPLGLAHNGNLTNAAPLRADLVDKGSIFQTTSDSEVLVHLIARSEAREPEDQLLDAFERVEGAYSLVITVGRTLYAVVDARGFRPLWLGRLACGRAR